MMLDLPASDHLAHINIALAEMAES
jgi:hypothetical protein